MESPEEIKKDNPIKNFCWPLRGEDKEECVQGYEDAFEEEEQEEKGLDPGKTIPGRA